MTDKTYTITLTAEEKQIIENALYAYHEFESEYAATFKKVAADEPIPGQRTHFCELYKECSDTAFMSIELFKKFVMMF